MAVASTSRASSSTTLCWSGLPGAEGTAEGEAQDEAARHRHGGGLLPVHHYHDRGDAGCFDGAGDQSARLMAAGSSGADDRTVHRFVLQPLGHLGGGHLNQPRHVVDVAHEAEGGAVGPAYCPFLYELLQAVDGKDRVHVLGHAVGVVVGVSDAEVLQGRVQGNLAVASVAVHVERLLVGQVDAAGGQHGNAGLGHGFGEGGPGCGVESHGQFQAIGQDFLPAVQKLLHRLPVIFLLGMGREVKQLVHEVGNVLFRLAHQVLQAGEGRGFRVSYQVAQVYGHCVLSVDFGFAARVYRFRERLNN